jgi:Flp pilus assembly protein TadG
MTQSFRLVRNERGAAIALVAVSMAVLLGMGALAVDLGMLMKQREDAQRAADAAALAGASAFMEAGPMDAIHIARDRAFDYLGRNSVGGRVIDTSDRDSTIVGGNRYITTSREGTVIVLPDSAKVRVVVRRDSVGSFFSGILGVFNSSVGAKAAAMVGNVGAARCLMPFALPDMWSERRDDDNGNGVEDDGEQWTYNPREDVYVPFDGGLGMSTGLGGDSRNHPPSGPAYHNDYGRPFELRSPGSTNVISPSDLVAWRLPDSRGRDDYHDNITDCNTTQIELGERYRVEDRVSNVSATTVDALRSREGKDTEACWRSFTDPQHTDRSYRSGAVLKKGRGSSCTQPYDSWLSSSRVILVPLFDPSQSNRGSRSLEFNNVGVFFIQNVDPEHATITARFLYFAKGTGSGSEPGSLLKQLRLSE